MAIRMTRAAVMAAALALFLPFSADAKDLGAMQSIHGDNLEKAEFVMRYKFRDEYGKSWEDSTFREREGFLNDWYAARTQEKKEDEGRQREYERHMQEIEREKQGDARQRDRIERQFEREAEEDKRAQEMNDRQFDRIVEDSKNQLDRMRMKDR